MNTMQMTMKYSLTLAALTLVTAASASVAAQSSIDQELENYWTVERDLPVLQERLYEPGGRFGLGIYTGLMSSEPYYWYIPVGGRLTYFFNDHAGIEVGGQYTGSAGSPGPFSQTTEIHDFFVGELGDGFNPDTDLDDRFLWRANATLLWSPLYGKWAFLNNKLSHFDLNLALGAGAVSALRPNYQRTEATTVITPELVFGGGAHFFLGQHFLLRADGRFYVYQGADTPSARADYNPQDQARTSTESSFFRRLQVPAEFQLGLTYLF